LSVALFFGGNKKKERKKKTLLHSLLRVNKMKEKVVKVEK
jgi:hypothetical protein